MVHGAPKTGPLQFAFDNNRVNPDIFLYTYRVNYLNVFGGERKFSVFPQGASDTLVAKTISLTTGKNYTIFIVDSMSKTDVVLVRDSSRAPGTDSVRIRFANMSPDAGALDLYIDGNNTPVVRNINYKSAGDFLSLKAANSVALQVRQPGAETVLAKTERMNLVAGNYYTIWTTGFKTLSADNAKLRVETFWH